jgi:hypothetical protein
MKGVLEEFVLIAGRSRVDRGNEDQMSRVASLAIAFSDSGVADLGEKLEI